MRRLRTIILAAFTIVLAVNAKEISQTTYEVYIPLVIGRAEFHVGAETEQSIVNQTWIDGMVVKASCKHSDVEKTEGTYDWTTCDNKISETDMPLYLSLKMTTHWANGNQPICKLPLPEHYADWARWANEAIDRYNPHWVEIWNEPDAGTTAYEEFFGCLGNTYEAGYAYGEFYNHIYYLQAARVKSNKLEQVTATDFSKYFRSILDKLAVLRRDPRIRFLMEEWTESSPSLGKIIEQLVGKIDSGNGGERDIRILDISGLPNEVAGPLSAMLARLLFQYKVYQTSEERKRDPVVLVCEEAHRYVPDRGEAEYAAAQSSIRRIAREGRKYGIGLMLVSQRPADVESTVISQCGTWLVLRLTNAADQQHLARFLPDGLSGMTRALPNLAQQEAIFVGEGAAMPARISIRDLTEDQLPKSETAKFASGWSMDRLSESEIEDIAKRMSS